MADSPILSPLTHTPSAESDHGDGSSAGSSVLGDGPGSDPAFRAKAFAQNRPCSPTALSAALLSLETVGSASEGEEEGDESFDMNEGAASLTGSEAGTVDGAVDSSGAGSDGEPIDEPIASLHSLGAPLLEQTSTAPPVPPPSLGPSTSPPLELGSVGADQFPPLQPPATLLVPSAPAGSKAASALVVSSPAHPQLTPPLPPLDAAAAGTKAVTAAAVAVGSNAEAGAGGESVDMVLFRRNQSELNRIRAQLKALKGQDLAIYQRGGHVDGWNFKKNHNSFVQKNARQVFVKKPQPIPVGPATNSAAYGPPPALHPPPPPLSKPWVAAVCSNLDDKRFNLNYRPPNVVNGEIMVVASDESLSIARSRWSDYLVGHFLEGRLPFPLVEEIANRMWAKHGLIETLSYNKEFFLFKFPEASSREKLLDHGPFLFGGRPLILQQWTPSLVLSKACLSKIPLWVKIYNIPLAMWNPSGLGDIASAIGVPLFADSTTEKLQRFDFARICVEVDATKPLLDEFKLRVQGEVVKLQVVYQWRPKRCPKCCTFGHQCPMASPPGTRPDLAQFHALSAPTQGLNNGQSCATATSGPSSAPSLVPVQSNATATSGLVLTGRAANAAPAAAAAATPVPAVVVAASTAAAVPDPTAGAASAAAAADPASAIAAPVPAAVVALAAAPVPDSAAVVASALDTIQALAGLDSVLPSAPLVVPVPAPVPVHVPASAEPYVDGLVEDASDDDDDYAEVLPSAMYYTTHSPKTRGQKAKKDLSLGFTPSQAKGSGKKGKKKGKRAKR